MQTDEQQLLSVPAGSRKQLATYDMSLRPPSSSTLSTADVGVLIDREALRGVRTTRPKSRGRPYGPPPVFLADCVRLDATTLLAKSRGVRLLGDESGGSSDLSMANSSYG